MNSKLLKADFVFETSWEVCNKVGGIYTVLSSISKTLEHKHNNKVCFIGPDIWKDTPCPYFKESKTLHADWKKAASDAGLRIRVGRWLVPGNPLAVLVSFDTFYNIKDQLYGLAWEFFKVDSLHAYGDYDEASMFSYAAGRFAEIIISKFLSEKKHIVYHAHEWMSGLGMMFLKKNLPQVATVFTTHATSIGRSITSNNKNLYEYFEGYNGDQMAVELNMEAKHSVEKQSAHHADCFTTVSSFTNKECIQLLEKSADVITTNGFENDFVPVGAEFTKKRKQARTAIINVAKALTASEIADDVQIVSTSGRNDFRCKGFDVYLDALSELNNQLKAIQQESKTIVLALVEVPAWCAGAREDLSERLNSKQSHTEPLNEPNLTHWLNNPYEDRILNMIKALGLNNAAEDPVKVIFVPCYLEGNDGIFNMSYYDLLTANDLCVYPSYYEPWGYTPLESCAFNTPCITTNLSGFGQWVNELKGHDCTLNDGVAVLNRNDNNYFNVSADISLAIMAYNELTPRQRSNIRKKAAAIASQAQWSNFVDNYMQAFHFALQKAQNQK